MAQRADWSQGASAAIPYMQRAVELDPQYAAAFAYLGYYYSDVGENELAAQTITKAYQLRDRLGAESHLRFALETNYFLIATGELDRALEVATRQLQHYPSSATATANIGMILLSMGELTRAVPPLEDSIRLFREGVYPYWNLMYVNLGLNKFGNAKAVFEEAQKRGLDGVNLPSARYQLAFAEGDEPAMQQQLAWAAGKPELEGPLLAQQADTEAYRGHLAAARKLAQHTVDLGKNMKSGEPAATWHAAQVWREAEAGKPFSLEQPAPGTVKTKPAQPVRILTALALARSGDVAAASQRADELNRDFPLDTLVQNYWLPCIRAAIALANKQPEQALQALERARAYEMAIFINMLPTMQPAYLRGEAYLMAGQGQQSAAEFERLLAHSGAALNFVTGALARLHLARAQVRNGDREAARKSYENFLTLWKDADSDIPI